MYMRLNHAKFAVMAVFEKCAKFAVIRAWRGLLAGSWRAPNDGKCHALRNRKRTRNGGRNGGPAGATCPAGVLARVGLVRAQCSMLRAQ